MIKELCSSGKKGSKSYDFAENKEVLQNRRGFRMRLLKNKTKTKTVSYGLGGWAAFHHKRVTRLGGSQRFVFHVNAVRQFFSGNVWEVGSPGVAQVGG